jgi:plasmid stabilization system protein ParE
MRGYRLSLQAAQRLEEIIGWTIDHFGIDQAIKYKDRLIARLSCLAVDEFPHGRPCNVLISGKRNVTDLEYYHEGRHYIIYRNTAAGLYVLDFVHSSRNLDSIIEDLSESS